MRSSLAIAVLGTTAGLLAVAGVLAASAGAQTVRRGVRVQVTTIEGGGGWSGTAFVSVPPSRLTVGTAPECRGVSVVGEGRNATGRIRSVRLELRGSVGERLELPIGVAGCPGATLTLGLDDGSSVVADAGTVTTSLEATGAAHGTFTATATSAGAPLAIAGDLTFAPRSP